MLKGVAIDRAKLVPLVAAAFLVTGLVGYALTVLWSGQAVQVSGTVVPPTVVSVTALTIDVGNVTAGESFTREGNLTIDVSPPNKQVTVTFELAAVAGLQDYEVRFYRGETLVGIIDPTAHQFQVQQVGPQTYRVVLDAVATNTTVETPIELVINASVQG